MAIEPRFRGLWQTLDGQVRIKDDDWSYSLGTSPYAISPDGLTLTYGGTVYQRVFGAGVTLVGVWRSTTMDGAVVEREEPTFTDLLTFTWVTTRDGQMESVYYGTYTTAGATLSTEEKRAWITKAIGGSISFHVPYGADQNGTYAFASDDQFTLTLGGVAKVHTRVP